MLKGVGGALGGALRLLGQAWVILGITLVLLLLVDQLLRLLLPAPAAELAFAPGQKAPPREQAAAVAGDDFIVQYWREHAAARHSAWRSYVYFRRQPYAGSIVNVDAHGFRPTPIPVKAPERYRIWVFGGSVVWGTGNRDQGTLPAQLALALQELAPDLAVEVLNFGESGYVSQQSLLAFQMALRCPEPAADLAIFVDGANDVYASWQNRVAGLPQNEDNRRREFNSSRRVGQLLRGWAQQLQGIARLAGQSATPLDDAQIAELAGATASSYLATLQQAQTLASGAGMDLIALWQPTALDRSQPQADEAAIVAASARSHVLLQRATRLAVFSDPSQWQHQLIDANSIIDSVPEPLFFDFVHLSERGQGYLAAELARQALPLLRQRPAGSHTSQRCPDRPLPAS